jgi:hypothetical protein
MLRLEGVEGNRPPGNTCDNWTWTPGKKKPSTSKWDTIIWQDEAVEVEGQPALVAPGMKGKVLSLHDGFHLDVAEVAPIPPRAMVQFENGMRLMVDERMRWERVADAG